MIDAEPRFRQLLPSPREVSASGLLDGLAAGIAPPPGRPHVLVNFVVSADGRASFEGGSAPLSDEGDRAMFHGLREQVDAVLTGTGTLALESYGRMLGRRERRERRLARGLPAEPLACVVSRSGRVPLEIPLFATEGARVALFTPREPPGLGRAAAEVELHLLPSEQLEPAAVLGILRERHGVRALLCEGGPTLFGSLLGAGVVDELFLTLAPRLLGGGSAGTLATGPEPSSLRSLRLAWLLEREGYLFLRYALARSG